MEGRDGGEEDGVDGGGDDGEEWETAASVNRQAAGRATSAVS